jgi:adenine phosphoribosyltransferase
VTDYLRLIDTTTARRYDVTPLFANGPAFAAAVDDLYSPFRNAAVSHVAGIDALGFVLGAAVARVACAGFVALRKGGRLPANAAGIERAAFVDYTGEPKSLELRRSMLPAMSRVLLVDDWIDTGAQIGAATQLLEAAGATIVGIAAIAIDLDSERMAMLTDRYRCHSLWQSP